MRPTAWRKKSSVVVVVANTPTRRRGMSTPSLTMRTATSHGSRLVANAEMRCDAVGSSLVTTTAFTPSRSRMILATPRAWSRSIAMTRPPASGCVWRTSANWAWARARASGIHSPDASSAVRRRWEARRGSRASSNDADCVLPSGPIHSISPPSRGKCTGRTTPRSASAGPYPYSTSGSASPPAS